MASSSTWKRVYRQTLTLIYKNLLIFSRALIPTVIRALVIPIAFTVAMCLLKHISASAPSTSSTADGVIAPRPIPLLDLDVAMKASSSGRLVFVRNGVSNSLLSPIVDGITQKPSLKGFDIRVTDKADDLFDLCHQTLWGGSGCFAAVIFSAVNDTNVDYSIALDGQFSTSSTRISKGASPDYQTSLLSSRLLPLQWEIDSQLGNLPSSSKPSENPWSGDFSTRNVQPEEADNEEPHYGPDWLSLVRMFMAPFFILIHLGVAYHLGVFVATERQSSISQLMQAQMVTDAPRIMSTFLSFLVLYFPGMLISSILLTQLLFTQTSDILLIFLTLLAGISLITFSHLLASFFEKAQLAGLYISTFMFALSLVSFAVTLMPSSAGDEYYEGITDPDLIPSINTQILALSLIFAPYTWATLIGDIANREYFLKAFSLSPTNATVKDIAQYIAPQEAMPGYLYVVFFLVQIVVYSGATYFIERGFWGVRRPFDPLPESSDLAMRCTQLSKTYPGKRRWYWPFTRVGVPNLAVQNLALEVKKGSVTFLLGPNGGGKTTTLKCVAGMTAMDTGSRLEINEAGTVFGICPQHNVIWDNLTVKEHIDIWRRLKTAAFQDSASAEDDVLEECDLVEKAESKAKTLSGGQMRKLQLAVCFTGGSSVCCIDEASSGLDPLSRRNIWNIIQKGHSKRSILITTHFLDEADVLADHIAIVYKGQLVCEGPSPSLKARFGGDILIRSELADTDENDTLVWRAPTSSEAARKVLELENLTDDRLRVTFPTLEKVFLNVTDSRTGLSDNLEDGAAGEGDVLDEKAFEIETGNARDINLDVGHSTGVARQVFTLFRKRYTLLLQRSGWISYGINLIIPIIIGAILAHYGPGMPNLQTCKDNANILRTPDSDLASLKIHSTNTIYQRSDEPAALVGPRSAFSGAVQDDLFVNGIKPYISAGYSSSYEPKLANTSEVLEAREFVDHTGQIVAAITDPSKSSYDGIAIWAPTPETAVIFHNEQSYDAEHHMQSFSLITNRLSNSSSASPARVSTTQLRFFKNVESNISQWAMPVSILLVLAFITSASIAVMYPTFEKVNRVRALHFSNGVSPIALWVGYLLFDMQFIIVQSFIVWGIAFAAVPKNYYAPDNILGAFILFGMATYLGTYVLSLFVKKAAFAIAAAVHVLLFILYLIGYVVNQSAGSGASQQRTYSMLQYVLGLTSPGANLGRAFFVSMNAFEVLCGEYGDDESPASSYRRYGSVYVNLLIQIAFLFSILMIYEYGSADWFRRHITHRGIPQRLHYLVDSGEIQEGREKASSAVDPSKILNVSRVTKFFGRNFANQNISFDIASNETLALLGANGAGKTTMINLIRGELKPDFGEITLDGISVLRNPRKARVHMGVCPQDDAVDNLTVRQTLSFYASVKGLKNVSGNVDKVLQALNIAIYEKIMVKALSGGTKRKLSVAIALLGNPRILLLDEPSTGQDAGAKRIFWKALQDISHNRAILLTTHSMEEAEALATNVAIMGTRMLATGTLSSLQEQYGALYSVRAVRASDASIDEVERLVRSNFGSGVLNYEDRHGQVSFNLPHDKSALGKILTTMERLKGEDMEEGSATGGANSSSNVPSAMKVLEDYTLTPPTLEEVFMQVARGAGSVEGV